MIKKNKFMQILFFYKNHNVKIFIILFFLSCCFFGIAHLYKFYYINKEQQQISSLLYEKNDFIKNYLSDLYQNILKISNHQTTTNFFKKLEKHEHNATDLQN